MGNVVIHSEANGVIEYNEAVPCIIGRYLGFMRSEEFRDFAALTLECCIKYKKPNEEILFIADTTKKVVQPKADTDWAAANLNPRALEFGIRFSALLLPEDVFGERAVKNYMKAKSSDQDEIEMDMFANEEDAITWFRTLIKKKELV